MIEYPLVVRNRGPLFYRATMLFILIGGLIMASIAVRGGQAELHEWWWPVITAGFTIGGLGGLIHALSQEVAVVTIRAPRSIHIQRGQAFRREERWTDSARLSIKSKKDNDGVNVFELWMEAPGGPLCIAEGQSRHRLELLQERIEAAVSCG